MFIHLNTVVIACIKKSPLKNQVTQSWLAIAATPISVNRLLPGRVTSALAPARHTERDISQHYSLSGYSDCGASGGGFTDQLITHS